MEKQTFTITFPDTSVADANRYAQELLEVFREMDADVNVEQKRTSENTQDMGATLVLLFGTPAIIAVAQGIKAWLAQRQTAKITIVGPQGKVMAENVTSNDAIKIAQTFHEGMTEAPDQK